MSFAEGFFGTLAQDIDDKQKYIREKVEQRSAELRRQGMERVAQVNEQRQAYETAASRLMRMEGVDQNRILVALESDPDSILDVYRRVEADENIGGEVINNFYSVYDNTEGVGTISEALDTILPISQRVVTETTDPARREAMTFAAMLGLDMDAALDDQVYNSEIVAGMTGNDILALGTGGVRARGTGQGTQLDYSIFSESSLYPEEPDSLSVRDRAFVFGEIETAYTNAAKSRVEDLTLQMDRIKADSVELSGPELEEALAEAERLNQEIQGINELLEDTGGMGPEFINGARDLFGDEIESTIFERLDLDPAQFYTTPIGEEEEEEETTEVQPDLFDTLEEDINPAEEEGTEEETPTVEEPVEEVPTVADVVMSEEEASDPNFTGPDGPLAKVFADTDKDEVIVQVGDQTATFRRDELDLDPIEFGDVEIDLTSGDTVDEALDSVRERLLRRPDLSVPITVRTPQGEITVTATKDNLAEIEQTIEEETGLPIVLPTVRPMSRPVRRPNDREREGQEPQELAEQPQTVQIAVSEANDRGAYASMLEKYFSENPSATSLRVQLVDSNGNPRMVQTITKDQVEYIRNSVRNR